MTPLRKLAPALAASRGHQPAASTAVWGVGVVVLSSVVGMACALDRFVIAVAVLGVLGLGLAVRNRFYLLGFLLPIYGAQGIPPSVLLVARLSVLLIIVLADLAARRLTLLRLPDWRWTLFGSALVLTAIIHPDETSLYLAASLFIGAAVGARIAGSIEAFRSLLSGYCLAMLLSAIVLLGQAFALFDLSPGTQNVGYWGLSYRSTAFSYEAALALVILWSRRKDAPGALGRGIWVGGAAIIATALLASGGRGGVIALAVAFVILPATAGRFGSAARTIAFGAAVVFALGALGVSSLSIDRLVPTARDPRIAVQDQYGSGRLDLYETSLRAVRGHVPFGIGFTSVSDQPEQGGAIDRPAEEVGKPITGHNTLLSLLVAGGLIAVIPAVFLLWEASRRAWRVMRRGSQLWVATGLAVFLVRSLFETDGGLLGGQLVLLFSALYTSAGLALCSSALRNRPRHIRANP